MDPGVSGDVTVTGATGVTFRVAAPADALSASDPITHALSASAAKAPGAVRRLSGS